MSLSAISSAHTPVNDLAVSTAPKAAAGPASKQPAPTIPQSDTVTVSSAARTLQSGDVDSDGDSH